MSDKTSIELTGTQVKRVEALCRYSGTWIRKYADNPAAGIFSVIAENDILTAIEQVLKEDEEQAAHRKNRVNRIRNRSKI